MSDETPTLAERRERLERKANVIRSRIMRRVDALDTRRHQVTAIAKQGQRFAIPAAVALVGGAVIAAGLFFGAKRLLARKPEKTLGTQLRTLLAAWSPPPKRPSILDEAVRRLVLTSVTIVTTEVARRSVMNLVDGRSIAGRRLTTEPRDPG